jgi:hypothetical protein
MMLDCWQQDRVQRPSFHYLAEVLQMLCRADKLKEAASANWGEVRAAYHSPHALPHCIACSHVVAAVCPPPTSCFTHSLLQLNHAARLLT